VYLGWDVGAWGCDTRSGSQDALVALVREGDAFHPHGALFRGNANRDRGLWAPSAAELLRALLGLVGLVPSEVHTLTIAIDAVLAWPRAFLDLLLGRDGAGAGSTDREPFERYLRRPQEVALLRTGTQPLSPITDSIGNQSTKAIHVLRRLGLRGERGVWIGKVEGVGVTAIETYPAPARSRGDTAALTGRWSEALRARDFARVVGGTAAKHHQSIWQDVDDAIVCAVVAAWFATEPSRLEPPTATDEEGWIWLPRA
jgi:hypothetical protein